jgi:hypothetical protein
LYFPVPMISSLYTISTEDISLPLTSTTSLNQNYFNPSLLTQGRGTFVDVL